jgi:DNA-binding protein H-NS
MTDIDLDNMDYEQLLKLRDRLIDHVEKKKAAALMEMRDKMATLGFTPEDLKAKKNGKRGPVLPKYRNPANLEETWSGRGKPPKWMQQHIDAGNDKEELKIDA